MIAWFYISNILDIWNQPGIGANMVAVPAGYDELVRFAHTTKPQKYRNVQRNPRVAMSISDPDDPYRYLQVRGDVERIEPDAAVSFFLRLQDRYRGDAPPPDAPPPGRLAPTPRTGWSSWCARPASASIKSSEHQ
jgi:PPOX class probable F420-dependent enzyme